MNKKMAFQIFGGFVKKHLMDFSLSETSGRFAWWTRERSPSGAFESIRVQAGTCDDAQVAFNISFVLHFFKECPVPPGVFGASLNLLELLNANTKESVAQRYLGGLNWLHFESANLKDDLESFFELVSDDVRNNFNVLATEIEDDPFRKRSFEHCLSLQGTEPTHDSILSAVSKFGEPRMVRGLGYSASKAARQIEHWLKGTKNWTEI